MSEKKTLKEISNEARWLRKDSTELHEQASDKQRTAERDARAAVTNSQLLLSNPWVAPEGSVIEDRRSNNELKKEAVERTKLAGHHLVQAATLKMFAQLKDNEAAKHYDENAAAYHDLAVIDAHMHGKTINVEQPLSIGQVVEVHQPGQ